MLKTYSRTTKLRELPVEYESACRLCLAKDNAMINIFDDMDMIPIVLKIRTCITIEIYENDKLPNMVCQSCLSQLNTFYTFKKRCLATNMKLQQYITSPSPQPSSSQSLNENQLKKKSFLLPAETLAKDLPVKETLDLTLCEDGNEDDIKNACTLTWEEKTGIHTPIFEFPVALMDNKDGLAQKHHVEKKPQIVQIPVKTVPQNSVNNAGYVSEDSMEDFAGFEEESEYNSDLKKKLNILNKEQQQISFPIVRRRGRPKKITNPLQCRVCYKIMESEKEVTDHMVEHALKHCSYCPKTFGNAAMMERHLRVHTKERPFSCDICGKAFSQKEILLRHKGLHSGNKPYACKFCGKKYSLPRVLQNHIDIRHSDTAVATRYSCRKCNKEFCYQSGLSRHQLRHTGVMFSCTVCCKVFTDSSSVKRHLSSHPTGKKGDNRIPYEIIKMELGEHSYSLASKTDAVGNNSESKDNPISNSTFNKCRRCSLNFNSRDELKTHNKVVHKEKRVYIARYECEQCGKAFRFPTGLDRHQLLHKGNNQEKLKKEDRPDTTGDVELKLIEEVSSKGKEQQNIDDVDNKIEEGKNSDKLKLEEEKNTSSSAEIIINTEKSIDTDSSSIKEEQCSVKKEEINDVCEEMDIEQREKVDDTKQIGNHPEEISITVEQKNENSINDKSEMTNEIKTEEIIDNSVEISVVPSKQDISETVDKVKEENISEEESKNKILTDYLPKENDESDKSKCKENSASDLSNVNVIKKDNATRDNEKERIKSLEKEIFG